jgi:hypothetical protein
MVLHRFTFYGDKNRGCLVARIYTRCLRKKKEEEKTSLRSPYLYGWFKFCIRAACERWHLQTPGGIVFYMYYRISLRFYKCFSVGETEWLYLVFAFVQIRRVLLREFRLLRQVSSLSNFIVKPLSIDTDRISGAFTPVYMYISDNGTGVKIL